ncbi:MAG: DUF4115 domain-containing protein [Pseudomonadales bacterium]|nr:DUF4115 domain-containing protein [Pseudomonadales bacterium]
MPIEQASTEQQALEQETETAGSLLAEARKARGLDEKQVADHLHITVHYVKAIEADLYEKLPGAIFARGYIKSYASYLGLDVEDILSRYQAVAGQQQSTPTRIKTPASSKPRRHRNLQWALASVGVFSAVIIAAWLLNGDSGSSNEVAGSSSGQQDSASKQTELPATQAISSAEQPVAPAVSAADSPIVEQADSQQAVLTTQADAVQTPPVSSADPEQIDSAASPAGAEVEVDTEPEPALAVTDSSPASSRQDVEASAVADSQAVAAPQPGETAADSEEIVDTASIISSSAAGDVSAAGQTGASQTEASTDSIANDSEEPAGIGGAAARTEELAVINVMQGSSGERIIAVDANGEDVLRISFSGESWVEVNDSQARMVYRDLRQAGDVLEITGHAPFNILLGDAPLTSLHFNGDEIDVSDDIRIDNSARLTVGL